MQAHPLGVGGTEPYLFGGRFLNRASWPYGPGRPRGGTATARVRCEGVRRRGTGVEVEAGPGQLVFGPGRLRQVRRRRVWQAPLEFVAGDAPESAVIRRGLPERAGLGMRSLATRRPVRTSCIVSPGVTGRIPCHLCLCRHEGAGTGGLNATRPLRPYAVPSRCYREDPRRDRDFGAPRDRDFGTRRDRDFGPRRDRDFGARRDRDFGARRRGPW